MARTYTVNTLNQMLTESTPAITYTYDATGNRTKRQVGTTVETLTYDFDNRLTGFHDGSTTTSYAYNGLGERVRNTLPTSPAPSVTFRASPVAISAGQSSTLSWTSTSTTTCTASGGWSGAKALNGTEVVSPTTSTAYTLSCTGSGGSLTPSLTVLVQDQTYAVSPTPMTTAPGGDLTVGWIAPSGRPTSDWIGLYRVGDPSTSYLWWRYTNGAGSGSFTLTAPATPGVYEFRYFLQNGYTEAARSSPVAVEAPSSPSTGTAFYWDGPEVVLETTGTTTTVYLHGPGLDELLSSTSGPTTRYVHQDALGSVVALTDATGTVVNSYAYEPFGTIRTQTGSLTNPWTFTGRPRDPESGLYFLRNRYYDSRMGTFVTQDPIGVAGGINLYAYVGNNPVNVTDPFGWEPNQQRSWGDWFGYNILEPLYNTFTQPGFNYGQWTVNPTWRNFYGASLDSAVFISGIYGAIEGVIVRGTPYLQYYPADNPSYQTRWIVRGYQPPYRPGQEAVEALNLPQPRNPGTAVRPVDVKWWEPVRGPRPVRGGTGQEYYRGWRWPDN